MFQPFGLNAYNFNEFGLPPVVLENWRAVPAGDRPDKGARLAPTPGTAVFSNLAISGRGLFQSDGVISGNLIAVHGTTVEKIDSAGTATPLAGSVAAGTDQMVFAASQTPELIGNVGGLTYAMDATTATAFSWAGLGAGTVSDVIEINQRHLYLETGTGRVWYSDSANAKTVQATSFVTAEVEPDRLIALMQIGGTLIFFGSQTYELWYSTGDPVIPLASRAGASARMGIIGRDAKAQVNGIGFFVRADGAVCQLEDFRARVISTEPLADAISKLSEANQALVSLTGYSLANGAFLHLGIPTLGDWFYDIPLQLWHRRRDLGADAYSYRYYQRAFGKMLAQATSDGDIVELSQNVFTDRGTEVRRAATALVPLDDGRVRINSLSIEGQAGIALATGQGSDPSAMLRVAPDGRTFGAEMTSPLGKIGEYGRRTVFGPLGGLRPPVMALELAVSDPVGYSVYGVNINPARP